jgi:aspartyl/asparaginyl-tRNA synthetase
MWLLQEMSINEHYYEVLRVLHNVFKDIFTGLENNLSSELATIRSQFASEPVKFTDEPCILHWEEAMELLTAKGFDVRFAVHLLAQASPTNSPSFACHEYRWEMA